MNPVRNVKIGTEQVENAQILKKDVLAKKVFL